MSIVLTWGKPDKVYYLTRYTKRLSLRWFAITYVPLNLDIILKAIELGTQAKTPKVLRSPQ